MQVTATIMGTEPNVKGYGRPRAEILRESTV